MREQLEQLVHTDRAWCQQRAVMALEMLTQYEQGEITQEEFAELMQDLVRADRLDQEADDLELKTHLVMAVYGAAQLV